MLTCNEQGLLMPTEGISTTPNELYEFFVTPFPGSEIRKRLFHEWTKYNRMLRQELGQDFVQWMDAGRPLPKFCDAETEPKG